MSFKKLALLLPKLDKPTGKRFEDYLASPYFKTPEHAILLFNYCRKLKFKFCEKDFLPDVISKKEKQLKSKNAQAQAATALSKALEDFLSLQQWEKVKQRHPLHLMQAQKQLGLYDLFNDTASKFSSQLENCKEKDINYYELKHSLTEIKLNGFDAKLQRNSNNNLDPVVKTLDEHYALKKLRYHCELLNRRQVLGIPYEPDNLELLLALLKPIAIEENLYPFLFVNVYYMMCASKYADGYTYYQRLNTFITSVSANNLPQGIKECIDYIINYCLFWNNKGEEQAGRDALQWYEYKIEKDFLLNKKMIQPSDFRAIVSLAMVNLKQANWIKDFIDKYSECLPNEHKLLNTTFVLAQFNYYIKRYETAIDLFESIRTQNEPIFDMILRRWHFVCLYEMSGGNDDGLINILTNWERQMYRNGVELHDLKQIFGKMIHFSKKLKAATELEHKANLLTEIYNEPFFAGKIWLIQQLKNKPKQQTEKHVSAAA